MIDRVVRLGLLAAAALTIFGCGSVSSSSNASDGNSSNQTPAAASSFSLSAPVEIAVTPDSLQTISISVVPANGFSSAVSVTLSGLPAGVTATPSAFTLTPGATPQTVAIQASAAVEPGPIDLLVTGTSGSLSQSMTTSTSQADFAFTGPSRPIALMAGGTAQVSVSTASFNGFSGQVSATLTGLPAGVTASPSTLTFAPGAAQTVTLTADASAQAGSSTLVLAGTSGTLSNNLELPLALSAAAPQVPDFSLSVAPSAITLAAGGRSGQVTLSAAPIDGFTGAIDVSLSGLPSGVVAMPASFALTPGTPQQISLTVAATDTAAAATLVFNAAAGTLEHTAELAVTITPPQPNFTLQVTPAALTLTAGGGAQSVSVNATALYGFSGPINLVLSGLPAAVTASPSNLTLTPGVAQTVNLTAGSNAAAGTATLNLLGTSGTISNSASVGLTIDTSTPDFVFSATPSTITVTPGTFQPVVLSIVPLSGFNSGVTVTTGSLPDGVVVSPFTGLTGSSGVFPVPSAILPLAPNVPEVLYVGLPSGSSAPVTIDLQAAAGALTHNATVTANPSTSSNTGSDLYLFSTPSGLLLYPGEPAQEGSTEMEVAAAAFGVNESSPTPTITLTSTLPSGMTSTVTNIPSNDLGLASPGIDVNFTVVPGLVGTSGIFAFQATSGAASGSMTREIDVPYSVVAGPELTQLLIPSTTLTLPQGSTEDLYVALASTQQSLSNEGAPEGTITITGLPFGVTSMGNPGLFQSAVPEQLSAAATTAVGQTPVTVTTNANGMTQTSQFTLNVVSLPNFTLTATPTTFDMAAGTTQTFTLEANAINGFTGDVSVNLTAAGTLTVTPLTLTLTPGTPQPISVTAPATGATSGSITVQATAGTLSQNLIVPVNVALPGPDFSIEGPPGNLTLGDYFSGSFSVLGLNGFVGTVEATITGFPPGLALGENQAPNSDIVVTPATTMTSLYSVCNGDLPSLPCAATYFEVAYKGAAAGTYPLTLTATGTPVSPFSPAQPITHIYPLTLTVTPPDFTLSVSPSAVTIAPGSSQTIVVTATPINSGTPAVWFSLSGLPVGVTETTTSSEAYTTTYTLSAASDAVQSSSTLAITGTGEVPLGQENSQYLFGLAHTVQVPLVIGP